MSALKKLLGQTAVYGLSSILGRMANYLLLTPLFARVFSVEQFGVITNTYSWVAMMIIFFTYGLETGFFRYATSHEDRKDEVYSTAFISVLGTSIILVSAIIFFAGDIATAMKYPEHREFIVYLGIIVGLDALTAIPFAGLRMKEKAKKFAFIRLFSLGVNIGLNFFFYVICPWLTSEYNYDWMNNIIYSIYTPQVGVRYVFIANLIASIVTFALLLPEIIGHKWKFDTELWKKLIPYSAPMLLVGLAGAINQNFDKLVTMYLLPEKMALHEIGIYGAIFKLSIMITLFIQAYQYAAEPFFFKKSKDLDAKKTFADVAKFFTLFTCVGFLGIMLSADLLLTTLLGKAEFKEGLVVLPLIMMGSVFYGMYYSLSNWYKLSNKTYFGGIISALGSLLTLAGNFLLIPFFERLNPGHGYVGCAITNFICYLAMVVISYFLGQKYYPINYDVKRILFYLGLASALVVLNMYVIENLSPVPRYSIGALLFLSYVGVAYILERPKKVII
ncbi:MAG: oligosaccharide flippase family protein [Bacteroidetes bacterium]|nr:oligosaccharide flippase family protein [Bacteroidota bacterium]